MVKSISLKRRWEIVFLAKHRHGSKFGITKISKLVNYSIGAVQHWLKVYEETGDVEEKSHTDRQKITSSKEDIIIKSLFQSNSEDTCSEIFGVLKLWE